MKCDYCQQPSQLVTGQKIYPYRPDLYHKFFYECEPCGAYVGCHPGSKQSLGRLANAELRRWKNNAHAVFDVIWKSRSLSRSDAYAKLAQVMGIEMHDCHIGMFDVEQCKTVVRYVNAGAIK